MKNLNLLQLVVNYLILIYTYINICLKSSKSTKTLLRTISTIRVSSLKLQHIHQHNNLSPFRPSIHLSICHSIQQSTQPHIQTHVTATATIRTLVQKSEIFRRSQTKARNAQHVAQC